MVFEVIMFVFVKIRGSILEIGRAKAFYWQNHNHTTNKEDFKIFLILGIFKQIEINLKKVILTFFTFTRMESVLIFLSFAHPCLFWAFLSFFGVLAQF